MGFSRLLLVDLADDALTSGALERAVNALEAHPNVAFACGRQIVLYGDATRPPGITLSEFSWRVKSGKDFIQECCSIGHNPVKTPTVVYQSATKRKRAAIAVSFRTVAI